MSFAATSEGWTLTLASSENEAGTLNMLKTLLRERKADGFILPRTAMDDARVNLLRASQTPFVLFGRPDDEAGCAWFDVLGENAMEQAVEHLFKLGHRHIGFVNGGLCYTYSKARRAGFIKGMANVGLRLDPALMTQSAVDAKAGAQAAMTLLRLSAPPTAIVYAVDIGALELYRTADQLGLTIGQDISVIAYDGAPEGAYLTPPLSTFAVRYREAGEKLAHLLIRRVRGEPPEELRETALADFLDKGSAGPPRLTPVQIAKTIRATLGPNLQYGRKDQ
ncbi:MAG: substrate-binding domain-containing protein [Rhodobacteraceae bacterium]|nr:substrate-binding domain-containing protein [Paracoccaceae bacterium]